MPVPSKSYKLKCQKCGYSKTISSMSDCRTLKDLHNDNQTCSKCNSEMKREDIGKLDSFIDSLSNVFK